MKKNLLNIFSVASIGLACLVIGVVVGKYSVTAQTNPNQDPATQTPDPAVVVTEDPVNLPNTQPTDTSTKSTDYSLAQGLTEDDNYFIGNKDANVVIIEYTDYQCPYCQKYFFQAFTKIKENYIKPGLVKYVVKYIPLDFHDKAIPALYAAKCAGEQGKFEQMHEKLFTYQNDWSYSDESNEKFMGYASDLQLDTKKFGACFISTKYEDSTETSTRESSKFGFSGTPSFWINGELVIGAQKYEVFKKILDSEVASTTK